MICTSGGVSILSLLLLTLSSIPIFVTADFSISIVKKKSGETEFQTSSELLLDGCSSFYEEANIFASPYPPDDCSVPTVVPQMKLGSQRKWVFVTLEKQGCDLRKLRELGAEAGFAAIIYGTEKGKSGVLSLKERIAERHKNEFLSENGKQGLIDVHLVHPLDIKIISRNFSFLLNPDYTLQNNVAPQCREVDPSTLDLHWSYFSKWAGYFWILPGKILIQIQTHLIQQLKSIYQYILKRQVLFQIIIIPISLIICVALLYCVSKLLYALAYIFQPRDAFQERGDSYSRTRTGQNSRSEFRRGFYFKFEDFQGTGTDNNNQQEKTKKEISIPEVKKHCRILGIPEEDFQRLTVDQINSAFRKKALDYHPDKHRGKSEMEIVELIRKFDEAKKSQEALLKYCERGRQ